MPRIPFKVNLKSIAIVLAITLCLALAALYALRDTSKAVDPSDSTSVAAILNATTPIQNLEFHTPQGDGSLTTSPLPGLFALQLPGATSSFPVTSRGDALIRVLLETKLTRQKDAKAIGTTASTVTFVTGQKKRKMSISTESNTCMVQLDDSGPIYVAERDLLGLLTSPSLRQLADTRLAPAVSDRASDIAIDSGGVSLRLNRTANGWAMTSPATVAADRNTAETTRIVLSDMPVQAIMWDAKMSDAALGFAAPRATIQISLALGDSESARKTFTVSIVIGADADVAGESTYAHITGTMSGLDRPIFGPYVVTIPKATLNRIPLAPGEYLSRIAATLVPSDIRVIAIGPGGENATHTYQLELTGWTHNGAAVEPSVATDLGKFVSFITSTRADSVSFAQRRMMPLYTVRVGPREVPNHTVLSIGGGKDLWWIQTTQSELRFNHAAELEGILQRLGK